MSRVEGKACVATGAGSGIGKAITIRLAEEGGKVLCVDISTETLAATVEEIRRTGGIADAMTADVSQSEQVDEFIARCVERYGGVDVLVNNAGVNLPGVFHEVSNAVI